MSDGLSTRDERPGEVDVDLDGDGTPDYRDADDDGDTISTQFEDVDRNGVVSNEHIFHTVDVLVV